MLLQTPVDYPQPPFAINPSDTLLLVGSCFANNIGQRLADDRLNVTVNPFGTMYNPVSVRHTVEQLDMAPQVVFITLGTNHVYVLKETGQVVDNCEKRPQRLFHERELSVQECAEQLVNTVSVLRSRRTNVHVVFTVSPIRYAKYGFHESQLSKATLLLAVRQVISLLGERDAEGSTLSYFPAYEIVLDELRDYRFYAPDMLHPSEQAVDYLYEHIKNRYFSALTKAYMSEWLTVKKALQHRPFNPDSEEYISFRKEAEKQAKRLEEKYLKGNK